MDYRETKETKFLGEVGNMPTFPPPIKVQIHKVLRQYKTEDHTEKTFKILHRGDRHNILLKELSYDHYRLVFLRK